MVKILFNVYQHEGHWNTFLQCVVSEGPLSYSVLMFPVPWFVTGVQTLSGTCRHVVWGISTQISFSAIKRQCHELFCLLFWLVSVGKEFSTFWMADLWRNLFTLLSKKYEHWVVLNSVYRMTVSVKNFIISTKLPCLVFTLLYWFLPAVMPAKYKYVFLRNFNTKTLVWHPVIANKSLYFHIDDRRRNATKIYQSRDSDPLSKTPRLQ